MTFLMNIDFYNTISLYMPEWKKEKVILDNFFNI